MVASEVAQLGRLWQRSPLQVCEHEGRIWVRAERADAALETQLRTLPGQTFEVLTDRQLRPVDRLVPRGVLPRGPWFRLADWLQIEIPRPALGGRITSGVSLQLGRGIQDRHALTEANVLVAKMDAWHDFAIDAPELRLNLWSFAMSDDQALIRGFPLPPLSGERFVERQGIATPAGWTWSPALDSRVVAESIGLAQGDLALIRDGGEWDHIQADDFVPATRVSVRASDHSPERN